MIKHPAKYSAAIIKQLKIELDNWEVSGLILDPFAGVGGVHDLAVPGKRATIGIELEPEWAWQHPHTVVGDATDLGSIANGAIDAIVTSPCYGNRMADKDMRDSVAGTYAKSLGHHASEGSACHMQWQGATKVTPYTTLHVRAWDEASRVLKKDGLFFLNISDHVRSGKRQHVAGWHVQQLRFCRLYPIDIIAIPTPRMRNGANSQARVAAELLIVLRKA